MIGNGPGEENKKIFPLRGGWVVLDIHLKPVLWAMWMRQIDRQPGPLPGDFRVSTRGDLMATRLQEGFEEQTGFRLVFDNQGVHAGPLD